MEFADILMTGLAGIGFWHIVEAALDRWAPECDCCEGDDAWD